MCVCVCVTQTSSLMRAQGPFFPTSLPALVLSTGHSLPTSTSFYPLNTSCGNLNNSETFFWTGITCSFSQGLFICSIWHCCFYFSSQSFPFLWIIFLAKRGILIIFAWTFQSLFSEVQDSRQLSLMVPFLCLTRNDAVIFARGSWKLHNSH